MLDEFRAEKMDSLEKLAGAAEIHQKDRYNDVPDRIVGAAWKFKFLAFAMIMGQFQLGRGGGGGRWIQQFVWGFPIDGALSQIGVYPIDKSVDPALTRLPYAAIHTPLSNAGHWVRLAKC